MSEVEELHAAVLALQQAEAAVLGCVIRARSAEVSWAKIALPFGITRWAARQRFYRYVSG